MVWHMMMMIQLCVKAAWRKGVSAASACGMQLCQKPAWRKEIYAYPWQVSIKSIAGERQNIAGEHQNIAGRHSR